MVMRRRIGRPSVAGVIYYAVLVIAFLVGLAIGGSAGSTVMAISAGIFALTVFATIGIGKADADGVAGRGRPPGPPPDR